MNNLDKDIIRYHYNLLHHKYKYYGKTLKTSVETLVDILCFCREYIKDNDIADHATNTGEIVVVYSIRFGSDFVIDIWIYIEDNLIKSVSEGYIINYNYISNITANNIIASECKILLENIFRKWKIEKIKE